MKHTQPAPTVAPCPIHDSDAAVTSTVKGSARVYRCAYSHDGSGPHLWQVPLTTMTAAKTTSTVADRVTDDLMEPLLDIVGSLPHVWIEYGVIEHELRLRYPSLFGRHVADSGHVALAPKTNTASGVRFAHALRRLHDAGNVAHYNGKPTGLAWKHDQLISFWARHPAPPSGSGPLSWQTYCHDNLERSTTDWTSEDRADIARLAAEQATP